MPFYSVADHMHSGEMLPERIRRTVRRVVSRAHDFYQPRARMASFRELFPGSDLIADYRESTLPLVDWDELPKFLPQYGRHRTPVMTGRKDITAILKNGLYCPINQAIMGPDARLVRESVDRGGLLETPRYDMSYLKMRPGHIGGHAMVLRSGSSVYYHVLMDSAMRLLALWRPRLRQLDEIQLLTSEQPSPLVEYLVERLAPNNCRIVVLKSDRRYQVDELIFTTFKTNLGYIPYHYAEMFRNRLLPDRPSRRDRRILISRENATHRRISNLDELKAALAAFGFEVVKPETLSVEDEIEIFYDAEIVIGAHGSGLTNIVFSESAVLIELFATQMMAPHFMRMSKCLNHEYHYLMGDGEDLFPEEYSVDVRKVLTIVEEITMRGCVYQA